MKKKLSVARTAVRAALEARIMHAYENYDIQASITSIEARILADVHTITDTLLGVNRRWSTLEIQEGMIDDLIKPEIHRVLTKVVAPIIEAKVKELVSSVSIQEALNAVVRARIKSALDGIGRRNCDIGNQIDAIVKGEVDSVFAEYAGPTL